MVTLYTLIYKSKHDNKTVQMPFRDKASAKKAGKELLKELSIESTIKPESKNYE